MTALAIGCVLAMLVAVAAIAPAFAGAQPAVEEYELGELPSADGEGSGAGGGGGPTETSAGGGGGGDSTETSAGGGAPSSGSGSTPTGGAPGSDPGSASGSGSGSGAASGDGSKSGDTGPASESGGAGDKGSSISPPSGDPSQAQVPTASSDPSDDGGVPVLLILLAGVAAVCTGIAIWRLRRAPDESEEVGRTGTGKTAETQSL
jgi:cobalamin biosynthesis Mg chelatase CobN